MTCTQQDGNNNKNICDILLPLLTKKDIAYEYDHIKRRKYFHNNDKTRLHTTERNNNYYFKSFKICLQ